MLSYYWIVEQKGRTTDNTHTNPEFKSTHKAITQATYVSSVLKVVHLPIAEFVTGVCTACKDWYTQ